MTVPISQVKMMEKARSEASFDSVQMAEVVYGSNAALSAYQSAQTRIASSGPISNVDNMVLPDIYGSTSREDLLLSGLRSGEATFEDNINNHSDVFHYTCHDGKAGNANPLGLTMLLFLPYLKLQGTDEQVKNWGEKAERGEIIGCYTQTELAHGSFVGGIETTATFDKPADEFVIHSPTLTSTKYWPGALGFIATHSITMARLIIDGNDYGVHAFMMQIRSLVDGKPYPGIELGDIGMKMSYNGSDNGYAVFNHVRIPRTNLLSRHSAVSRSGEYTSAPLRQKLLYGGMLNTRSILMRSATSQLAQALTIATRYSMVRTQGLKSGSKSDEQPIFNYQHQKHRLLSLMSRAYISILASQHSRELYCEMVAQQANGNHEKLPFMHMLFCGLKAWTTQTASEGAEEARKMCGGHGYMLISGLPEIVTSLTAICTFEGENFVLWGQVARYLMKGLDGTVLPDDLGYMCCTFPDRCTTAGQKFSDHQVLMEVFQQRAKTLACKAHALVRATEAEGKTRAEALNLHSLQLLLASCAHIEVYLLSASISRLDLLSRSKPPTAPAILAVLSNLISLFALTTIASPVAPFAATFLSSGYIAQSDLVDMRVEIDKLLEVLAKDAVALTDAWSFSDATLASAIGCRDGDAYKRIMAWTRQLQINVEAKKTGGVWKKGSGIVGGFLKRGMRRGGVNL